MKILVVKATVEISSKAPDASIGAELERRQGVARAVFDYIIIYIISEACA